MNHEEIAARIKAFVFNKPSVDEINSLLDSCPRDWIATYGPDLLEVVEIEFGCTFNHNEADNFFLKIKTSENKFNDFVQLVYNKLKTGD